MAWISNSIHQTAGVVNANQSQCLAGPQFTKKTLSYWYKMVYNGIAMPIRRHLFNSLWPSDTIWRQRSGSTLAQVMACCLTAQSHYLNQCWLIISGVQWHSYQGNFTRDASTINHWNPLENYIPKISFKLPRGQWVNGQRPWPWQIH